MSEERYLSLDELLVRIEHELTRSEECLESAQKVALKKVTGPKKNGRKTMMNGNGKQMDLNLVDKRAGAIARDRAIEQVARATGEWQVDALAAIRAVAAKQPELTTDDVWLTLGRDPEVEGRAMGAAMMTAAKLGLVQKTDRTVKSHRVACHRRDLRIWKSLIFSGAGAST